MVRQSGGSDGRELEGAFGGRASTWASRATGAAINVRVDVNYAIVPCQGPSASFQRLSSCARRAGETGCVVEGGWWWAERAEDGEALRAVLSDGEGEGSKAAKADRMFLSFLPFGQGTLLGREKGG